MKDQIYFRTSRFQIDPIEEDLTNPGCFGKELSEWLCVEMKSLGYRKAEVIHEDFGWCVMCSRDGFMLWIGCGSVLNEDAWNIPENERPLTIDDITWTVFPVAEIPFYDLKAKFLKMIGRIDPKKSKTILQQQLKKLLESQSDITCVDEP